MVAGWTAAAQAEPEEQTYSIDSVAVTASRVPVALHASARTVTLIDSEAIAAAPVETVNDLLKYAAGVDVRQRGAFGMQTDISMRGGTYNQVAVLLNGINITDPQTGHNSFDFPVSLSDIDHIEILEGPAARVYGTSALVGAINIVTKKATRNSNTSTFELGSFGYKSGSSSQSIKFGRSFMSLSAGHSRSNGFSRCEAGTLNSDFKSTRTFLSGGSEWRRRNLAWQAGVSHKNFGAGTFYSSKYDNQYESTLKAFAAIKSEGKGPLHFTPAIYWNYGKDRFELFRGEPDKYPFNYHKTKVLGANLNFWTESRLGRTSFGAEARRESIISTNLGEPLQEPKGIYPFYRYTHGLSRTAYNLFLEHNVVFGRLSASAGVTAVYNTGNTEGVRFFPGADVSYRMTDRLRFFASWNTSYRMPTFTDLYYSVGGHLADPNLKSEKMNAIEVGAKYSARGWRATGSLFCNSGRDMIDWIKDTSAGEDAPWTSVNHSRLSTYGCEAQLQLALPTLLNLPGFFARNVTVGFQHMGQDKKLPDNYRSMYSLEYVRTKATFQADFDIWKGLGANLSYIYVNRATDSPLIKPYSLLDAKLDYDFKRADVYLRFNNILNRTYYDFGEVPQPGFWFIGGVTLILSWR